MRFMQFRAHDKYALHLSKMEKVSAIIVRFAFASLLEDTSFFGLSKKIMSSSFLESSCSKVNGLHLIFLLHFCNLYLKEIF